MLLYNRQIIKITSFKTLTNILVYIEKKKFVRIRFAVDKVIVIGLCAIMSWYIIDEIRIQPLAFNNQRINFKILKNQFRHSFR